MPAKSSVGTSAVSLTGGTATYCPAGVLVAAAAANTGTVYVGTSAAVTANTADATDGVPLAAGASVWLPPEVVPGTSGRPDAANVHLIASAADQKVFYQVNMRAVLGGGGAAGGGAVTNAGTFAVQVDGAALTALQLIDDPVVTLGTATYAEATSKGVVVGAVRRDADTTLVDTTNEFGPLQMDASGRLKVEAFSGETLPVAGGVAHDGADADSPVKVGGQARTTNPAAVADADRVNFIADKLGKQVVVGSIRDMKGVQHTAITSSTAETTVVTAVASTFLDVYGLILANKSATATTVTIKDATAGTTRAVVHVPAGDTRGFMLPESGAVPQAAVNNNWTATSSASIDSLYVTALYVKNI